MEFNSILNILESSALVRESVDLNGKDATAISYTNHTGNTMTATVDGDDYDKLLKVCLVTDGDNVDVYLNTVTRFKLNKFDLESVSSFSIS